MSKLVVERERASSWVVKKGKTVVHRGTWHSCLAYITRAGEKKK